MKPTPTTITEDVLNDAQALVESAESLVEQVAAPARREVLTRFPIMFLLLVTFGVSMILFGIEQVLVSSWLSQHPWLSIVIGVTILVATGRLYKKLG